MTAEMNGTKLLRRRSSAKKSASGGRAEHRLAARDVAFVAVHHAHAPITEREIVAAQRVERAGEVPGQPEIVRAEVGDPGAARELEPPVEHARNAAILGMQLDPQPRRAGELFEDPPRAVGRGVVDRDHLEPFHLLSQRALQRAAQVPLVVVRGDDRRHERAIFAHRADPAFSAARLGLPALLDHREDLVFRSHRRAALDLAPFERGREQRQCGERAEQLDRIEAQQSPDRARALLREEERWRAGPRQVLAVQEQPVALADHAHAALRERAPDRAAARVHDPALRHHDAAPAAPPRAEAEIDVLVVEGMEEVVEPAEREEALAVHGDRAAERKERVPGQRARSGRTDRLRAAPAIADPAAPDVRHADRHLGDAARLVEHERRRREHVGRVERRA
jgi:hypothetical protein